MQYIDPDGNYPNHYGDIQLAHPSWKLGDSLPDGWQLVESTPLPALESDETVEEADPEEIGGVMKQVWSIRKMTAEEIERRDAPANAKAKLMALGLTEVEIEALVRGLVR